MCIVIDINTLHLVFHNEETETDFTPVRDWIMKGKGRVVYGGSTFRNELLKARKYLRMFKLLNDQRKVVSIDDKQVDDKETEIKKNVSNDCDDPHIIAIIAVSGCKLICSKDSRSYPFLKQIDLYSKGGRPKIYSKKRHSALLNDNNIAGCCEPAVVCNKKQFNNLNALLVSL